MKKRHWAWVLAASLLLAGCTVQGQSPPDSGGIDPDDSYTEEYTQNAQTQDSNAASGANGTGNSNLYLTPSDTEAPPSDSPDTPAGQPGYPAPTDTPTAQPDYPAPTGTPWSTEEPVEAAEPVELDGLRFVSFGRYSGAFFEDGSDTAVENVAIVLVVNTTERFLELATFSFEIDGASATFTVTNLPPQRGAWVLEKNALTVQGGASFVLKSGSTTFCTPEEVSTVTAQALDGTVMVENHSESESFSGYIYYKTVYEDGNYLGGVTYRSLIEDLPAQSRTEITAAHCDETAEIIRIVTTE